MQAGHYLSAGMPHLTIYGDKASIEVCSSRCRNIETTIVRQLPRVGEIHAAGGERRRAPPRQSRGVRARLAHLLSLGVWISVLL